MQYTFMQILTPNYTPNFCPQIGISLAFAPNLQNSLIFAPSISHYENTPIQKYRKFHLQKLKIFR